MTVTNRELLKKMLAKNIFSQHVQEFDFEVEKVVHSGFYGYATIYPKLDSYVSFSKREVRYEKFKLQDYKLKESDHFVLIAVNKVSTKEDLINYLNSVFLHSVQIRENNSLNSYQFTLKLSDLKPFTFNQPTSNYIVKIQASENNDLFYGSVTIKFI